MAERFDSMYDLPGSLEDQLDEVTRFVQELALASPVNAPPIPQRNPARSPTTELPDPFSTAPIPLSPPPLSPRRPSANASTSFSRQRAVSATSVTSGSLGSDASPQLTGNAEWATTPPCKRVSDFSFGGSSVRDSTGSYASSASSAPSRGSLNSRHAFASVTESIRLPLTPELSETVPSRISSLTPLPPPAIRPTSAQSTDVSRSKSTVTLSPFPAQQESITMLHRSSTTASQKAAFEKDAFRNSAVLCDVRGKLVEYSQHTQPDPDAPSDIADIEMVEACESCRIAVVRKRITDPESRLVRVVTSIWALSDDNDVRVELKMEDGEMYIPYSSYFSPVKASITVPCELRFHDVRFGNRLVKSARTSWVNYVFEDTQAAALFQNEIMGRTLLATFRTSKTMRIHEGALSAFAYAEQMCALETLRIWEDADTGAVIGLIHFSASFRAGYLAFYLNSSTNPIKVQDIGVREVKIKGLRVPIAEAFKAMRKDSVVDDGDTITELAKQESGSSASKDRRSSPVGMKKGKGHVKAAESVDRKKVISGAKIEFASEAEKTEFLLLVQEYQKPARMCELPDLLGVN
ncbi:hypothetical protein E8E13_001656 [Curvularia kusanoi]|uniref:Uncharacterized protein n=1 Tax=Curvularia kusanoi TaxID=90978 RepID=A0A9P4T5E1_CURKU|nr:hypothetical protein E8E13_001656 [Curvularia kusanoi]